MRMQKVVHYKTKITINILMTSMTFLLLVIFVFDIKLECVFKNIFNVSCPACGLTRAFKDILNFNFIDAFKHNVLSIPLFFSIFIFYILYLIDFIFNKDFLVIIYNKLSENYLYIIIVLLLLTIINNV